MRPGEEEELQVVSVPSLRCCLKPRTSFRCGGGWKARERALSWSCVAWLLSRHASCVASLFWHVAEFARIQDRGSSEFLRIQLPKRPPYNLATHHASD